MFVRVGGAMHSNGNMCFLHTRAKHMELTSVISVDQSLVVPHQQCATNGMFEIKCVNMTITVTLDIHAMAAFFISCLSYAVALWCNGIAMIPFYVHRTRILLKKGINVVPISQFRINRHVAQGSSRSQPYYRTSDRVDAFSMADS